MSIQQEALPRRGTALREAFHRTLKAALQCPPVEVWAKAQLHSTSLLLLQRLMAGAQHAGDCC